MIDWEPTNIPTNTPSKLPTIYPTIPTSNPTELYTPIGPYCDSADRNLRYGPHNWGYTPYTCYIECKNLGYKYFGLQAGSWCSCDNNFEHATRDGYADGTFQCNSDSTSPGSYTCNGFGGNWCNYIYQNNSYVLYIIYILYIFYYYYIICFYIFIDWEPTPIPTPIPSKSPTLIPTSIPTQPTISPTDIDSSDDDYSTNSPEIRRILKLLGE